MTTNAPHHFTGHRVKVYRNLNKPTFWSFKAKGLDGSKEKVQGYFQQGTIINVTFTVQPAAQKKIAAGGERYVHAFAIGELMSLETPLDMSDFQHVEYNPKRAGYFYVVATGEAVTEAALAVFINNKMYCLNPN